MSSFLQNCNCSFLSIFIINYIAFLYIIIVYLLFTYVFFFF